MQVTYDWKNLEYLQNSICVHDETCYLDHRTNAAIIERVNDFAIKMAKKNQSARYYQEQRNASSPMSDIRIGKKGEFVVACHLQRNGWPVLMPDCEVRHGSGKGWDCDLPYKIKNTNFANIHVKTCDRSTLRFAGEYTWTFQYNNKYGLGGRDDLFDRPDSNELVAFVYMDSLESSLPKVVATAPWNLVHERLKDPISRKYVGLKKCVYYRDLCDDGIYSE